MAKFVNPECGWWIGKYFGIIGGYAPPDATYISNKYATNMFFN